MHTLLLITLHNNSIAQKQQTSTYCTSPPPRRKSHPPKHLPHPTNRLKLQAKLLKNTPRRRHSTPLWPTRKLTSFWGARVAYFEANSTRHRMSVGVVALTNTHENLCDIGGESRHEGCTNRRRRRMRTPSRAWTKWWRVTSRTVLGCIRDEDVKIGMNFIFLKNIFSKLVSIKKNNIILQKKLVRFNEMQEYK